MRAVLRRRLHIPQRSIELPEPVRGLEGYKVAQIVPKLANEGRYPSPESNLYLMGGVADAGAVDKRSRERAPRSRTANCWSTSFTDAKRSSTLVRFAGTKLLARASWRPSRGIPFGQWQRLEGISMRRADM